MGALARPGRTSTTRSRLSNPSSPIYALASRFQEYMHFPDPTPLYVLMGAVAGNMMKGKPIWLMMVGASGTGKSMLLESLDNLPHVVPVSSIKGEAALLSGVKKKERAKDATGGLLHMLGPAGCMVFSDFTGVLSKSKEAVTELLGVFRDLYDGKYVRDIGGEGGLRMEHKGKVYMIAGVTHAIDRHVMVNSEMGERCLYFRYPQTDGYQESMHAANVVDPDANKREMQGLVDSMFHGLGLGFRSQITRRRMTTAEIDRIVSIAQLGSRARSGVPRDQYGPKRDVIDVVTPEIATRMTGQLAQLFLGMEYLGLDRSECWRVMEKVALDSMPLARRLVIQAVMDGVVKAAGIAAEVRISESAARRVIEDLELLGILEKRGMWSAVPVQKPVTPTASGTAQNDRWELTDWARERLERGLGAGKGELVTADLQGELELI